MRAVHVTHSISRLFGGPFESVRHLLWALQSAGAKDVSVLALRDEFSEVDAPCWAPIPTATFPLLGPAAFGYAPKLKKALLQKAPDVVHLHGLWKYPSLAVLLWARLTGRPYMISPHGMLEPWALAQSRLKKQLSLFFYQRASLAQAACLRATSAMEMESIRSAGFRNPIALIANGVHPPPPPQPDSSRASVGGLRTALFLSRIHPKKGLLDLVEAWRRTQPEGWRLVIVGPDEGGHLGEVQRAVLEAGLSGQIEFAGESWGDQRWKFYRAADLFILPSRSENFGMVIAEALACGVPVLTTRGTPWEELLSHRCGWWVAPGVATLIPALVEATGTPEEELRAMGQRGKALVEARYGWAPIGRQLLESYEWMLGRRQKPAFIHEV